MFLVTRTPFRISFAGGGSDRRRVYEKMGGLVVSAAINQYMYLNLHPSFEPKKTMLKYSETEVVEKLSDIRHNYFRAILTAQEVRGVEIASTADVPAGTGLGSSSAFAVGLLQLLHAYRGRFPGPAALAEEACRMEIDVLGNPIGKQDQYAAAFGGLNAITFLPDGEVRVEPLAMAREAREQLERRLLLFYTGKRHSAGKIFAEQDRLWEEACYDEAYRKLLELAKQMRKSLEAGRIEDMGPLLRDGWEIKRTLSQSVTDSDIDRLYRLAMENGATGGKLLGAGGGGFLLFDVPVERQEALRRALPLQELSFAFEDVGSCVLYDSRKEERADTEGARERTAGQQSQDACVFSAEESGGEATCRP